MDTSLAAFAITAALVIVVWIVCCPADLWLSLGAMLGLIAGVVTAMRIAKSS